MSRAKHDFDLPYYNTTNYPLAVRNQLTTATYDEKESILLKYHQFVVKEFFTRNPQQRGILVCHGMGFGKTRLAVSIAEDYRTYDKGRRIIVLSAKSLATNFREEVKNYTKKSEEYVADNYQFVSLNSSNMFKQITNINKSGEELLLEKKLGEFLQAEGSSLENSMLIIDEAHNLFNSATNGAKNALALYDLIMNTENIKLIFMSGTPVINGPFELVPCFNMLRGYIRVDGKIDKKFVKRTGGDDDAGVIQDADTIQETTQETTQYNTEESSTKELVKSPNKHRGKSDSYSRTNLKQRGKGKSQSTADIEYATLFSEDADEFDEFFVNADTKTIKNKDKFTNRIFGLVSYYGDLYFVSNKEKPGFPKELDNVVEKVPMSQEQFAKYMAARILEQEETKSVYKGAVKSRFSASKGSGTTYRVKSRQISNYCIPEYALGPVRGMKAREKFIDRISIDDLQNLDNFSPKMGKILSNIEGSKHNGQLGMVYSQFVSGEGIGIFARVLKAHGYKQFGEKTSSLDDYGVAENKTSKSATGTFAILSGDIDPEERQSIIDTFNNPNNANGSMIKILLLSGAVAEGIDLKRIRHVHVMEPFWNYARINQVKTRAIRYLSHKDLPESEQNVQVYIYLSDYPLGYPPKKILEPTTDVDLYDRSISNMKLIDSFMVAIAEASIDCAIHHAKLDPAVQSRVACKLCAPDNVQLFHPLLRKDMEVPCSCKPYTEKKVSVEEIQIEGSPDKYYYKKDPDNNITLYHFSKKLNGYAPMLRTSPLYGELMEAVLMKTMA